MTTDLGGGEEYLTRQLREMHVIRPITGRLSGVRCEH